MLHNYVFALTYFEAFGHVAFGFGCYTIAMKLPTIFTSVLATGAAVFAATPDQWRSRSIYQVLTDRYVVSG